MSLPMNDPEIASAVSKWFKRSARDLPWRKARLAGDIHDPYHALVAEAMLQQTQVSRVLEKFVAFIELFPAVSDLASASEDRVLAAWTGLGYYRRARNLHAAAKLIVSDFAAQVPSDVPSLLRLPGVGRYTAGAIASIAFNKPDPIVDGNVARVLLRIHSKEVASDDKAIQPWLWQRADELVRMASSPALFNEGLMELGATICLPAPAMPLCEQCPLKTACVAYAEGKQLDIPLPKARAMRTKIYCATALVRRPDGQVLVERRPDKGMWGGMWQAPTIENTSTKGTAKELAVHIGVAAHSLQLAESFVFLATHRELCFQVYLVRVAAEYVPRTGEWVTLDILQTLAVSSPQSRIFNSLSAGQGLFV